MADAEDIKSVTKVDDTEDPNVWKKSIDGLRASVVTYEAVTAEGDDHSTEEEAMKLADAMRTVGDSHTDPVVRARWYQRAHVFSGAGRTKRQAIARDIGGGFLILLATPVALTGVAVVAVGGIIYGVGSIFKGFGEMAMGGCF